MITGPTVFVVDDDEAVRVWLRELIRSVGLQVQTFASAREFLDAYDPAWPGCVVLDIRMPGMSGLDLQTELVTQGILIPIIIVTGHGDVAAAVRAMKAQAVDFVQKPCTSKQLLDLVQEAIERDAQTRREQAQQAEIRACLNLLTPRGQQVLDLLIIGKMNKQIAAHLGIRTKTVESHRASLMKKLRAETIADLVRMALLAKGNPATLRFSDQVRDR